MGLFKKIKSFFYNSAINNAVKSNKKVRREMLNFDFAKRIGILYNATKTNDVIVVNKFADSLKRENKEVYTLGYQDRKLQEENMPSLFDNKNVNWYKIPDDKKIDKFQHLNLDILICAFEEECLPLEYIAATSKAKFRVGAFSSAKINYYELMINTNKKQDLSYLLNQILHFLKDINKDDR